ncbi:DNA-directed DNA polymerase [Quillaja saponaria]|uniref:DNA-directed DNA polymerase n=1 Tax=Quillaja saponaria TaxID=32244 RepID=A0AAD7VHU6_QUISA|nr:DNA-directed DNA polymerase [Quillaja saponaria]
MFLEEHPSDPLEASLISHTTREDDDFKECMKLLDASPHMLKPNPRFENLDLPPYTLSGSRSSIEEPHTFELKSLPNHVREHKRALGWTIANIKGISLSIYMHKILMEDNHKFVQLSIKGGLIL